MDRFRFPIPSIALILTIVALGALATMALMAMGPSKAGAAPVACADQSPWVKVDYSSSTLSQVPIGVNVAHKARLKTSLCPGNTFDGVTLTFIPPGGQTLVTTGNTGAWTCNHNADESLTCTRVTGSAPAGLTSTLTFTYKQGPYQDSPGRAHGCVTVLSPSLSACNQAWFKALP